MKGPDGAASHRSGGGATSARGAGGFLGGDDASTIITQSSLETLHVLPWYVIDPSTRRKVAWDLWIGFLILYSVVTVPFNLSFLGGTVSASWDIVDNVVDVMFGIDIVMQFFTSYVDPESSLLMTRLPPIMSRYSRSWFAIDFISTVPLASIKGLKVVRVIRLTRLLKLLRLLRLSTLAKKADTIIDVLGIPALLVRIVGIVTKLLLIAHLTACLWWAVAQLEISSPGASFAKEDVTITANSADDLDGVGVGYQYIVVLYFSLVTMFGIGYGEYAPMTPGEKITAILVIIVGSASVGYLVGNISSVVNARNSARKQRMTQVKQFMRDRKFPTLLKGRVRQYFSYYLAKKSMFDEQVILDELSPNLRLEMVLHHYRDVVNQVPFFKQEDGNFVAAVLTQLKPMAVLRDTVLYKQGDYGMEMFFLLKGVVEATVCELSQADLDFLSDSEHLRNHVSSGNMTMVKRAMSSSSDGRALGAASRAASRAASMRRLASSKSRASSHDSANGGGEAEGDANSMPVGLYTDGAAFGQVSLVLKVPRETSMRSLERCELMALPKQALEQLLPLFPATAVRMQAEAEEKNRAFFWARLSMTLAARKRQGNATMGLEDLMEGADEGDTPRSGSGDREEGGAPPPPADVLSGEIPAREGRLARISRSVRTMLRTRIPSLGSMGAAAGGGGGGGGGGPEEGLTPTGSGTGGTPLLSPAPAPRGSEARSTGAGPRGSYSVGPNGSGVGGGGAATDRSQSPLLSSSPLLTSHQPSGPVHGSPLAGPQRSGGPPPSPLAGPSLAPPGLDTAPPGSSSGSGSAAGTPAGVGVGVPGAAPLSALVGNVSPTSAGRKPPKLLLPGGALLGAAAGGGGGGVGGLPGSPVDGGDMRRGSQRNLLGMVGPMTPSRVGSFSFNGTGGMDGAGGLFQAPVSIADRVSSSQGTRAKQILHSRMKQLRQENGKDMPSTPGSVNSDRSEGGGGGESRPPGEPGESSAAVPPTTNATGSVPPSPSSGAGAGAPGTPGSAAATPPKLGQRPSMFDVMQMLREQRQEEQQRQAMQEAHILVNGEMVSVRTLPTNFVRRLSVTSSRLTAPPPARTQGLKQSSALRNISKSRDEQTGTDLLSSRPPLLREMTNEAFRSMSRSRPEVDVQVVPDVGDLGLKQSNKRAAWLQSLCSAVHCLVSRVATGTHALLRRCCPNCRCVRRAATRRYGMATGIVSPSETTGVLTPSSVGNDVGDQKLVPGNSPMSVSRAILQESERKEGERKEGEGDALAHKTSWMELLGRHARQEIMSEQAKAVKHRRVGADVEVIGITNGVIHPSTGVRTAWDLVLGVFVVFTVLVVPYRIAFSQTATGGMEILELVVDFFFLTDVIVNFFTGFHDPTGLYVCSKGRIAARYLKGWFALDIVSSVPVDFIAERILSGNSTLNVLKLVRILRLARLLKLFRLSRLTRFFARLDDEFDFPPASIDLLRLLLQVILIGHFFACLWMFITVVNYLSVTLEEVPGPCWWRNMNLDPSDPQRIYINSVYFVFVTMATVGYGDILPTTPIELLVDIFIIAVGTSVFGYVIASISDLVVNGSDSLSGRSARKLKEVRGYLREQHAPPGLRDRVMQYAELFQSRSAAFDEDGIMIDMTESMRRDVMLHINQEVIRTALLLRRASMPLVVHLISMLTPAFALPDEIVLQQGDAGTEMYFVMKGVLVAFRAVPDSDEQEALANYNVGDHFGEWALLTEQPRVESVKALSLCNLLMLSKDDLEQLMIYHLELLHMLKRGLVSKMQRDLPANPTAAQRATAAAEVEEAFAKIDMIAQAKLERFEAEQFKTLNLTKKKHSRSGRAKQKAGVSQNVLRSAAKTPAWFFVPPPGPSPEVEEEGGGAAGADGPLALAGAGDGSGTRAGDGGPTSDLVSPVSVAPSPSPDRGQPFFAAGGAGGVALDGGSGLRALAGPGYGVGLAPYVAVVSDTGSGASSRGPTPSGPASAPGADGGGPPPSGSSDFQ